MAYADYRFYVDEYKGEAVSETAFPRLSEDASGLIDQMTYGRLKRGAEVTRDVKMAVCAVAEALQKQQAEQTAAGVESETVGSYSVSYEDASVARQRRQQEQIDAAGRYLLRTDPLRYAGVY